MVELSWLWVSFSSGLLAYLGWFLIAPALPIEWRLKLGRFYFWLAATSFWRPKIVRRLLGGYSITSSSYDADKQGEKLSLDGGDFHIDDPENKVSRLQNKHFGLVLEHTDMMVDAELAELGEHHHDHVEHGHATTEVQTDRGTTVRANPYFHVPKGPQLCDPVTAMRLIPRDADPDNATTAEDYTASAFSKYKSSIGATEAMSVILGFAAAFFAVAISFRYFLDSSGGGGSGGSVVIPLGYVDVTPLLDVLVVV